MGDFFERKSIKKPTFGEFDLKNESDLASCGLDAIGSNFAARNNSFFESLKTRLQSSNDVIEAGEFENPVAVVAELAEQHFSSREISFLIGKTILNEMLQN